MPTRTAAIGVDIGGTAAKAAVVAADGEILTRSTRPTDRSAGTKTIIAVVEDLVARAPDVDVEVSAVGIGAAGFIDAARGAVTFSPNLTYDDPEVAAAVKARIDMPVVIDNDANAAAWGELTFGAAQGMRHVVVLTLGTGFGSGFIVDGRLVRGASGAAAELGHTVVDPDGPSCPCGLRGCLEQFASGRAIARMAREALESPEGAESTILAFSGSLDDVTAEHVAKAARQYDEVARGVLRHAGRYLGIGLSNAANLFDPEAIVLCGSVVGAGEVYLGAARDELARMTSAQRRRPMRLEVTKLGHDAGIVGAAALTLVEQPPADSR